jgi:hypothetical protein
MKSVGCHSLLCRRGLLGQNTAHTSEGFVTRNKFHFARLNLRDSPAHFIKVRALNVGWDILRQTCDQTFRQLDPGFGR